MSKMYEIVDTEAIKKLYPKAVEALETTAELRMADPVAKKATGTSSKYSWRNSWDFKDELAEPVARYVHARMMAKAVPDKNLPQPYTHTARLWMSDAMRTLIEDLDMSYPGGIYSGKQVQDWLLEHKLAARLARPGNKSGASSSMWMLREWPANKSYIGRERDDGLRSKDLYRLEKRVEEEADKEVVITYDLTTIPVPEKLTPETAVEYIGKLRKCHEKLQESHSKLKDRATRLSDRVEELELLVEELKGDVTLDGWNNAHDQIKELMS